MDYTPPNACIPYRRYSYASNPSGGGVLQSVYYLVSVLFTHPTSPPSSHPLHKAHRIGRVDVFVQSTDKNLLVPVGGAIVASSNEPFIQAVAQTYPGERSDRRHGGGAHYKA